MFLLENTKGVAELESWLDKGLGSALGISGNLCNKWDIFNLSLCGTLLNIYVKCPPLF